MDARKLPQTQPVHSQMHAYPPPCKPHLPPLHLSINGTTIEQVTKFYLLGLYINDTQSWDKHISQIVSKVSKQIYLLR